MIAEQDSQIAQTRDAIGKRRELMSRKETALLEWSRRNRDEALRLERDQKEAED